MDEERLRSKISFEKKIRDERSAKDGGAGIHHHEWFKQLKRIYRYAAWDGLLTNDYLFFLNQDNQEINNMNGLMRYPERNADQGLQFLV
jgi:hypothetical protein